MDESTKPNFMNWHEDQSMFGKHYLVYSSAYPKIKRQYTICNTFIPEWYEEILKVAKNVTEGEPTEFNSQFYDNRP